MHHHHKHQGLDQFDPFRLQSYNHTTTDHKEGEQLEDRRNVGENNCNSGDGTDQTGPTLDVYDDDA